MLSPIFIAGFSGHRPSDAPGRSVSELEAKRESLRQIFKELQNQVEAKNGRLEVLTSVAEGADTLVCELVIELKLPLHIILPKSEDRFAQDFENASSDAWHRVEAIVAHARSGNDGSTIRIANGSQIDPGCYQQVNIQILEASDVMVFLSDETKGGAVGGTNQFLQKVSALERPHCVVSTVADVIRRNHLDKLTDPTLPSSGLEPFVDLGPYFEGLSADAGNNLGSDVGQALASLAGKSSRWFRFGITSSVVCHGLAALVAAILASFYNVLKDTTMALALSGFELILVFAALLIVLMHHRMHTQTIWLRCRLAREILRSVNSYVGILDPFSPLVQRHSECWGKFARTAWLDAHRKADLNAKWDELKDRYINERILHQVNTYFDPQYAVSSENFKYLSRLSQWASLLAVLVVAIAFSYKVFHWIQYDSVVSILVYFLPVGLPLLAGMASSLITVMDYGRRSIRYEAMVHFLSLQQKRIRHADSKLELEQLIRVVEEALFYELMEWYTAAASGQGH